MQAEEWTRRVNQTGMSPVVIPLLEVVRALGFVAAQALLLGQPLLAGLVNDAVLQETTDWLEDPIQAVELLQQLEEGADRQ